MARRGKRGRRREGTPDGRPGGGRRGPSTSGGAPPRHGAPHGRSRRGTPDGSEAALAYEAEILPGLAPFAREELDAIPGVRTIAPSGDEALADALAFRLDGAAAGPSAAQAALDALRTVTAVYRVVPFDVPRPKALLGDEHFRRLVDEIRGVLSVSNGGGQEGVRGFRLEAAGSDSPVVRRLRHALAKALGLEDDPEEGELRLRMRPTPPGPGSGPRGGPRGGSGGWDVLIRRTPRPLSARAWRVCNRAGGLNACVAAAAWRMAGAQPEDRVLNAMCGSGTLLVERAALGPAARLTGIDLDADALRCAEENLQAAGVAAELVQRDVTRSGLPEASFDVIVADPPWGDAVGDRHGVEALHPAFLREAARLLTPGGRLLVVTHALRAFEEALQAQGGTWEPRASLRVFHGGHRPAIRLLRSGGA